MNENAITAQYRDIGIITAEIRTIQDTVKRTALEGAVEIGRRLAEAKELLPHGEWSGWLKDSFDFSQRSASRMIQLYEEYGGQSSLFGGNLNSPTLANLSVSNALRLIVIPEDEREEFAKEYDVENLSARELEKLIKERDEEKSRADTAEKAKLMIEREREEAHKQLAELRDKYDTALSGAQRAEKELNTMKEKLQKAKDKAKTADKKLKELRENPEIPKETMDRLAAEAEKKAAEEAAATMERKTAEIRAAKETAEKEAKETKVRLEALEKQLQLASPDAAVFKMLFQSFQEEYNKLSGCLLKIKTEDPTLAEKLMGAVRTVLNKFGEAL